MLLFLSALQELKSKFTPHSLFHGQVDPQSTQVLHKMNLIEAAYIDRAKSDFGDELFYG